jgi:hypothetical protein
MSVAGLADDVLDTADVAEVSHDEPGLATCGGDLLDDALPAVGVAAVDEDFGALAGELHGGGAADAGRGAGDECLEAVEIAGRHCSS